MSQRSGAHRLVAAVVLSLAGGCGNSPVAGPVDPPAGPGDPEDVTVAIAQLMPASGGTAILSLSDDPDGSQHPLPDIPPADTLVLHRGVIYDGTVTMINDLDPGPALSISNEVRAEANFHRFFYALTCAGATVPVASLDRDTQSPSQPLGTAFQVVVDAAAPTTASCSLNVQLHHFRADKGDGTGTNFQADLGLDFPVSIRP
jgi:hypothetical protein